MNIFEHGWPWYIAGPLIFLTMATLVLMGRRFGVSMNFETLCTLAGGGRFAKLFDRNWRTQAWNLAFLGGAITGGFITHVFGADQRFIPISEKTVTEIAKWGFTHDVGFAPKSLVGMEALSNPTAWILLGLGGFLVGFGTRWAAGCTSGHAISGMSDLQKGSFIAVASFFGSGLLMTNFILPWILG